MGRQESSKTWAPGPGGGSAGSGAPRGFGGAGGEVDEETKKNQNIINIVREGQISLLVSETNEKTGNEQSLHLQMDVFPLIAPSFFPLSHSSSAFTSTSSF